mmetsp:Transcript_28732/g.51130  ORF Transcript_28732/g.51130 Transcript_28732/m.51130 type:complete len:423 (+) Transcript_28732:41-1309(+)
MGELNCKLCDCRDPKTELEARNSLQVAGDYTDVSFITEMTADFTLSPISVNLGYREVKLITKFQAAWRGYRVQKLMIHLRKARLANYPYFSSAERKETLRNRPLALFRDSKTVLYKAGGSYTGELLGGFRDGYGRMKWPDGAIYEGYWSYGIPHGEGIFKHVDGEEFEGNWTRFPISYREVFLSEGDLKLMTSWPFKNGFAWLCYKNEYLKQHPVKPAAKLYAVNFVKSKLFDLQNLQAKLENQIQAGLEVPTKTPGRESRTETYENGNSYAGEWLGTVKDGHGKYIWSSGDTYEGEWRQDSQTGWGKSFWASEDAVYIGEMRNGRKHGVGEYRWKDGSTYKGQWQLNNMHGHGLYVWPDGRQYLGSWESSKMQGYGIFSWPDGRRYEGAWDKGLKNGTGTSVTAEGTSSTGTWSRGRIVKA